jgi:hypothetical protein
VRDRDRGGNSPLAKATRSGENSIKRNDQIARH